MKIFVVGAHGQIGQLLVHKLLDRGDTVTGGYRDPLTQTPDPQKNFRAVELNLAWPVSRLTELFAGHDAIIFAAGSRGKDLLGVDLDGAIKTMKAAEAD
ncbi:MAG TPA: nucleoside-diphosphate sugar epimerase, partial [Lactobacillus sp.]|nr:nucleoside-diphosphate sugar epimerase [Lactobacillus sp.]